MDEMVAPDTEHPERPCSCCPQEIRNLAATAHNLLSRLDRYRAGDVAALARAFAKAEDLRAALAAIDPHMQAHFADRRHSHAPRETT